MDRKGWTLDWFEKTERCSLQRPGGTSRDGTATALRFDARPLSKMWKPDERRFERVLEFVEQKAPIGAGSSFEDAWIRREEGASRLEWGLQSDQKAAIGWTRLQGILRVIGYLSKKSAVHLFLDTQGLFEVC